MQILPVFHHYLLLHCLHRVSNYFYVIQRFYINVLIQNVILDGLMITVQTLALCLLQQHNQGTMHKQHAKILLEIRYECEAVKTYNDLQQNIFQSQKQLNKQKCSSVYLSVCRQVPKTAQNQSFLLTIIHNTSTTQHHKASKSIIKLVDT